MPELVSDPFELFNKICSKQNMYIASAYSIEFYTVKISIWTGLVVILTKIRVIRNQRCYNTVTILESSILYVIEM